jgi:hypothetical protein
MLMKKRKRGRGSYISVHFEEVGVFKGVPMPQPPDCSSDGLFASEAADDLNTRVRAGVKKKTVVKETGPGRRLIP